MQVTLVLPWLNEAEQDIVYPEGVRFQQPADQVPVAGRLAVAQALPVHLQRCLIQLIPAVGTSMPCHVLSTALQGLQCFSAAAAKRLAADEVPSACLLACHCWARVMKPVCCSKSC